MTMAMMEMTMPMTVRAVMTAVAAMTTVAAMTAMTAMAAMTAMTAVAAVAAVAAMTATLRIGCGAACAHHQTRHAKRDDGASPEHGARC